MESAEVLTLLELITVIERKGRNISLGKIRIDVDYKRVYRKILNNINKSNEYAQEAGAIIIIIKRIIKKIKFKVEIQLLRGHKENIGQYRQNQLKYLIKQCDRRARKKREEIELEI